MKKLNYNKVIEVPTDAKCALCLGFGVRFRVDMKKSKDLPFWQRQEDVDCEECQGTGLIPIPQNEF